MPGSPSRPRVFSIPAGEPFLPVLADALLDGRLVSLDTGDPMALAGLTVYLPTRRAVRAFRDALAARLQTAILPEIRPLGDLDETDLFFTPSDETTVERLEVPPPISFLSRHLALTRLVLAWRSAVKRGLGQGDGQEARIPASATDAARLARDLARLGDDMAIAGVSWDAVSRLVSGDHARYFELTLDFLKIFAEQWPAYLAETGRLDPAARRDQIIRRRAAAIASAPAARPTIVAGSTGSMPATAELIRAVATLANGAVVLPGLDQLLDADGWNAIGTFGEPDAADAHPQFALKQLIARIGIAREDVADLAATPSGGRAHLLAEAMRPAATADRWRAFHPDPGALDGVSLLVARNEQEEATAIALALREAVEADQSAALVTPDRTLARRVTAELQRWALAVDDSAGGRLDREPAGTLARLIAEAGADPSPVHLLALAKHPLAAFGMPRPVCRSAARALEIGVLRGRRPPRTIADLPAEVDKAAAEARAKDGHAPRWRRRIDDADWTLARRLAVAMATAIVPLSDALTSRSELSAAEMSGLLRDALTAASTDAAADTTALWTTPSGQVLDALLDGLANEADAGRLPLARYDAPFFLSEMMRDAVVPRATPAAHHVHIWGVLEARLQSVDLMIVGGADEGIWPAATRTDAWLSRAMRAEVGLPPPERRVGLSAHDFVDALSTPKVIVTRAEKRGGAPTVESRWLQRIRALSSETAIAAMTERGGRFVAIARQIDAPSSLKARPITRPEPRPPLAARPHSLSVTEIETLIRDPYAVYAKHVLRLQPLDDLGAPADARVKGTLVHEALGRFVGEWTGAFDSAAEQRLNAIAAEAFGPIADAPDVLAVWRIRFAAIARWLIAFEASRSDVERRYAEIAGRLELATAAGPFALTGRADRVDLLTGDALAIYDFKTGTPQSERSVFAGLTPQMTLEAAMARRGAFTGIAGGRSVRELAWLAVGKCGRDDPYVSAVRKTETADSLAERAYAMLDGLIQAYADAKRGYVSRARPMMERTPYVGDYDHLARVSEWALVETEEDLAT